MTRSVRPYGQRTSTAGRLYLETLLDPRRGGVKVPDSFAARTATVQLQQTIVLSAVSIQNSGVCGALLTVGPMPYYGSIVAGGTAPYNPLWQGQAFLDPSNSKLKSLFSSARVVSASLRAQFTGTTQSDQGTITLFALDRLQLQQQASATTNVVAGQGGNVGNPEVTDVFNITTVGGFGSTFTIDNIRNLPVNAYGPARNGGTVRFFPVDSGDIDFTPLPPGTNPISTGVVGCLGFVCEGLSTTSGSSASVIVEMIVNLEAIPNADSFHMVTAAASPVDSAAMSAAQRAVARQSACVVSTRPAYSMRAAV